MTDEQPSEQPSEVGETPTEWPEEVVGQIRAAEAAQQRSLCIDPDDAPRGQRKKCADVLAQALDRRVEVNLDQYDGGEVRRVGYTDPRVRELEAPWTHIARRAAGSTD